jgi:hypothetical protein
MSRLKVTAEDEERDARMDGRCAKAAGTAAWAVRAIASDVVISGRRKERTMPSERGSRVLRPPLAESEPQGT